MLVKVQSSLTRISPKVLLYLTIVKFTPSSVFRVVTHFFIIFLFFFYCFLRVCVGEWRVFMANFPPNILFHSLENALNCLLQIIKARQGTLCLPASGLFKDFQGYISHFFKDSIQCKKEPRVYIFFSSSTT